MALPGVRPTKKLLTKARRMREDFHRHPELGYQERRTASVVAEALRAVGVDELRTGVAETGVVGLLRGGRPGATVALRSEMDGLPVREETGLPYASVNDGVMHACGHDGHMAILLAVGEMLAGGRDGLRGNVKFIFQPAEEGGAGGRRMVEAGVLEDPHVDAIFALHGSSGLRPGAIQLARVPYAAMNGFRIEIHGRGGHGAMPQTTVNPIEIGARIVGEAQTMLSRVKSPDRPAVLSFGAFSAGAKENVIPDAACIMGTIRAAEMKVLRRVRRGLERLAKTTAKAARCEATVTDTEVYPPVKNDARLLEMVRRVGAELLGSTNVLEAAEQRMSSEDFAFYLSGQGGAPGVVFRLGIETTENHHTGRFDFGTAGLEPGIAMMTCLALAALER